MLDSRRRYSNEGNGQKPRKKGKTTDADLVNWSIYGNMQFHPEDARPEPENQGELNRIVVESLRVTSSAPVNEQDYQKFIEETNRSDRETSRSKAKLLGFKIRYCTSLAKLGRQAEDKCYLTISILCLLDPSRWHSRTILTLQPRKA